MTALKKYFAHDKTIKAEGLEPSLAQVFFNYQVYKQVGTLSELQAFLLFWLKRNKNMQLVFTDLDLCFTISFQEFNKKKIPIWGIDKKIKIELFTTSGKFSTLPELLQIINKELLKKQSNDRF